MNAVPRALSQRADACPLSRTPSISIQNPSGVQATRKPTFGAREANRHGGVAAARALLAGGAAFAGLAALAGFFSGAGGAGAAADLGRAQAVGEGGVDGGGQLPPRLGPGLPGAAAGQTMQRRPRGTRGRNRGAKRLIRRPG